MNTEAQIFEERYWTAAKLINRAHLCYAAGCSFIVGFGFTLSATRQPDWAAWCVMGFGIFCYLFMYWVFFRHWTHDSLRKKIALSSEITLGEITGFACGFGLRQANYKFQYKNKTYKNFDLMGSETYYPTKKVSITFNPKNPKQNYLDTSTSSHS